MIHEILLLFSSVLFAVVALPYFSHSFKSLLVDTDLRFSGFIRFDLLNKDPAKSVHTIGFFNLKPLFVSYHTIRLLGEP